MARAVHRDMLTLFERLLEVEGIHAQVADLEIAHDPVYIERVAARCREAEEAGTVLDLEGEVRVSGASWDALLASVGCVLTAVEKVEQGEARNAFCAVRPPGHGAGAATPGGFSIFNGAAIAALRAARRTPATPVWVIDLGARRGGGTAELLAGQENVALMDIHEAPADGDRGAAAAGVIHRALPPGSGIDGALSALRGAMDQMESVLTPELIILSLGCDALAADPLGRLALQPRDYHALTLEIRQRADRLCGERLVSILEEGYAPTEMGQAVVQHLRALADLSPEETG